MKARIYEKQRHMLPIFIVEAYSEGEEAPSVAYETAMGVIPGLTDHKPN